MNTNPAWVDGLKDRVIAIEPDCPRLADMTTQWIHLTVEWLQTEARLGHPAGATAEWVQATAVPDLTYCLERARKEPGLAHWLEDGIGEFGLGIYMASLKDHEEQGIWVVDFPSAVMSLVRDLDRS